MKSIIFVITILMGVMNLPNQSNQFDYEKAWSEVDALFNKGLPKSALVKIEEILVAAKKEKNDPQLVKCMIFLSRVDMSTDESGMEASILRFEKLIQDTKPPVKNIAYGYLAELYDSYFSNNRYSISQRSEMSGGDKSDFRTWSSGDFQKKISEYYFTSLSSPELSTIPTDAYKTILNTYDSTTLQFRSSVYEILADRAIHYFNSNSFVNNEDTKGVVTGNSLLFSERSVFILLPSDKEFTETGFSKALEIYRTLIKMHMQSGNRYALAEYDLARLQFVFNHSTHTDKNKLFENSLQTLSQEHKDIDYYSTLRYHLALHTKNQTDDTLANQKAVNICEEAIKAYPLSDGSIKCTNLIDQIKQPNIQLLTEEVYNTNSQIRIALDHNNVEAVVVSVVQPEKEFFNKNNQWDNEKLKSELLKLKSIQQTTFFLKTDKNFQSKRFETELNKLPVGTYVVIAKTTPNEKFPEPALFYSVIHISDLSFITYTNNKNRVYLITDRESGKPVKDVTVQIFEQKYIPGARSYNDVLLSSYKSDKNGKVLASLHENRNTKVVLEKGKDKLDLSYYVGDYFQRAMEEQRFIELYSDRSIYRPGQIVYYKGIVLKKDSKGIPSIIQGGTAKVLFRDANGQEVSVIEVPVNDFGSFSGSFTIPVGRLSGTFYLEASLGTRAFGTRYIQVEEYKRPRFEVTFDTLDYTYKLNQTISVTGKALSLAGSSIDGAKVNYTVVRMPRYRPWQWWYRSAYQSPETVIATGETETDNQGIFKIDFEALPDLKEKAESNPFYHFRIVADITDQTGETRSASSVVTCGYAAFVLSTNFSAKHDVKNLPNLEVQAFNGQGNKVNATGNLKIYKLKEPSKTEIRPYWSTERIETPIGFNRRKPGYYTPNYEDQADISKWKTDKLVFDNSFTTYQPENLSKVLLSGVYKMVLQSQDEDGVPVNHEQFVVITDFAKKVFPKSSLAFAQVNKESFQPGETMTLETGTSDKGTFVQVIIEKDGKILREENEELCNYDNITMPVDESLRGGFSIYILYNRNNRSYLQTISVAVPWTNKDLKIEFETFRDKLLPGQDEVYKIKILGAKKDGVVAEMMASMYDASLDQFTSHSWNSGFYPTSYPSLRIDRPGYKQQSAISLAYNWNNITSYYVDKVYPMFIPLSDYMGMYYERSTERYMSKSAPGMMMDGVAKNQAVEAEIAEASGGNDMSTDSAPDSDKESVSKPIPSLTKARTELDETVFFYPHINTDKDGNIILTFKMKEALTRWKLMSLVYSKSLEVGYDERTLVTQKELMVFPNGPRFFREGDNIRFSGKVSNLSDKTLSGVAVIQFFDALTMEDVTSKIISGTSKINFTIDKGRSEGLYWDCIIPVGLTQALTYRVSASSDLHTDAEENTVPVISNRMLVTETMPMHLKGNTKKNFVFKSMQENTSSTKKDFNYSFEFTSNPVWYAVQALPYIMEYPRESTDQIMNRYYANVLAGKIANTHPKIQAVFKQWLNTKDSDALKSNLHKNQELKAALLEETPWVVQALSEAEQKRNIALLFDLNKMQSESATALEKLKQRQLSNGGFAWFSGGRDNEYITQNIMENLGHLRKLGALPASISSDEWVQNALKYTDLRTKERFDRLKEQIRKGGGKMEDNHLDHLSVHYLYTRSFFPEVPVEQGNKEAFDYYMSQVNKYWLNNSLYMQAMIGLILHRSGNATIKDIMKSLKERSFSNPELGMYWNEGSGYFWYQLPIERHSLLIELFAEAGNNKEDLDNMKIWLLKNKQTNHWKTSKSTAAAIYALLIQGEKDGITEWIGENNRPVIQVGASTLTFGPDNTEAGTGYFKQSWKGAEITKDMSSISITNTNKSIAWGAAYYQYFEDLDKIKGFEDTPLKLKKQLYKNTGNASKAQLQLIDSNTKLAPGDKLTVRIELRVDRAMEYVHMKDMRASGLEPVNVISGYKYQGQLGYYESTKDIATHFFMDYLPKGTFVFEYPLIVVHEGVFSSGISTIQCMYAPEFSSHSQGDKITVTGK
ncbi:MAG: hypothetical protein IPM42_02680 [Saprospiraceae bacterium]|nr:hypothetical protein [Saprospiraceae bacterium]